MRFLLYLSGEHVGLAKAEVEGVLAGERVGYGILSGGGGRLLLEVKARDPGFVRRLALTRKAVRVVGKLDDAATVWRLVKFVGRKSFRVSSSNKGIEREFGGKLVSRGLGVNLSKPGVEVVVDGKIVGVVVPIERDFGLRKPQFRPYFHPTSMHPKLARTLVNLAAVRKGEMVIDPFCGTGGILVEAGLMGVKVVGGDVDDGMVGGCRLNLAHYGLAGRIKKQNALDFSGVCDAVVTDPPYGRGSYTGDMDAGELIGEFVSKADGMVKKGGRVVVVAPKTIRLSNPRLAKLAHYDIRVHKSLTRRIHVFTR